MPLGLQGQAVEEERFLGIASEHEIGNLPDKIHTELHDLSIVEEAYDIIECVVA